MGSVSSVINALNAAGIRADRAYPGRKLPRISQNAAAVMLESRDHTTDTDVVRVTVCSPSELGGGSCEDAAKAAGEALAKLKRSGWKTACQQDTCSFSGPADQYQVIIRVTFTPEQFTVTQNSTALSAAVAFEAWRNADAEKMIALADAQWQIRLEELIFGSGKEVSGDLNGFKLKVTRKSGTETFENCSWTGVERVDTPEGLRQIRTGTAASRAYTAK